MTKTRWFALMVVLGVGLSGCGPDTIFVRPGLDTPAQHVANGHQLLERGKIDDACREFKRAKELDPDYITAYVGLGLALGQKGDIEAGMHNLSIAKHKAVSVKDFEAVQQGYDQLNEMKRLMQDSEDPH